MLPVRRSLFPAADQASRHFVTDPTTSVHGFGRSFTGTWDPGALPEPGSDEAAAAPGRAEGPVRRVGGPDGLRQLVRS